MCGSMQSCGSEPQGKCQASSRTTDPALGLSWPRQLGPDNTLRSRALSPLEGRSKPAGRALDRAGQWHRGGCRTLPTKHRWAPGGSRRQHVSVKLVLDTEDRRTEAWQPADSRSFAALGRAGPYLGLKAQHRPHLPVAGAFSLQIRGLLFNERGQVARRPFPGARGFPLQGTAQAAEGTAPAPAPQLPRKDTHPHRGSALEPENEAQRRLATNAAAQIVEQGTCAPGPRLPRKGLELAAPPPPLCREPGPAGQPGWQTRGSRVPRAAS